MAIENHLPRNSGLFPVTGPSYELKKNCELARGPLTSECQYRTLADIQYILNGSQLARELGARFVDMLALSKREEHTRTFLAIMEKSARILRGQYGTALTALLWPDFEFIAPELEKRGIPVILARNFLKDWNEKGAPAYQIAPIHETHPNTRATRELADGLAAYLRNLEKMEKHGTQSRSLRQ